MFDYSFSPNVQKFRTLDILPREGDRPAPTKWKSAIYWQEHCVECAIPDCYQTCQLFIERVDGKCARFKDGINPYWDSERRHIAATGVEFRRWGQLEAVKVQPFCILRA